MATTVDVRTGPATPACTGAKSSPQRAAVPAAPTSEWRRNLTPDLDRRRRFVCGARLLRGAP